MAEDGDVGILRATRALGDTVERLTTRTLIIHKSQADISEKYLRECADIANGYFSVTLASLLRGGNVFLQLYEKETIVL